MKNISNGDLDRFSIDTFIKDAMTFEWGDLTRECLERYNWADNYCLPKDESNYRLKQKLTLGFVRFLNDFMYILQDHEPGIPRGMSFEIFSKIRPIIRKLVVEGRLHKGWLDVYSFMPDDDRLFSHIVN